MKGCSVCYWCVASSWQPLWKTGSAPEDINVISQFSEKEERETLSRLVTCTASRTYLSRKDTSCLFWFSLKIRQHVHLDSHQLCVLSVTQKPQLIPEPEENSWSSCQEAGTAFTLCWWYFHLFPPLSPGSLPQLSRRLHPQETQQTIPAFMCGITNELKSITSFCAPSSESELELIRFLPCNFLPVQKIKFCRYKMNFPFGWGCWNLSKPGQIRADWAETARGKRGKYFLKVIWVNWPFKWRWFNGHFVFEDHRS